MQNCVQSVVAIMFVLILLYYVYRNPYEESFAVSSSTSIPSSITSLVLTDEKDNLKPIGFPKGMILMFFGDDNQVPMGWQLCDGTNGTPDLRGRFPVGLNPNNPSMKSESVSIRDKGDVGGVEKASLEVKHLPKHKHSFTASTTYNISTGSNTIRRGVDSTTEPHTTNPTGGSETEDSEPHENMPPFVVVNFIMKM
jgi:hypothetical protein